MAKEKILITEQNLSEWIYSVGILLPSNEVELARFEALYPTGKLKVNEASIDPLAIINGTRVRKNFSNIGTTSTDGEQQELRMAARKHQDLPPDIIALIKRNQQSNEQPDSPENS